MRTSIACVVVLLAGCSNSSPANDGGSDAGMGQDVGTVNGCTTFTDETDAGTPTITGPSSATPAQYTPNCVHIKVGQSVTWTSNFGSHPLQAAGGTTPSPITGQTSGTSVTYTFTSPGTYGYECGVHPAIMNGAVEVTP